MSTYDLSIEGFTLALAALRGNEVNFPSAPKAVIASTFIQSLIYGLMSVQGWVQ